MPNENSSNERSRIVGLDGLGADSKQVAKTIFEYPFTFPSDKVEDLEKMCMVMARHPISQTPVQTFGYIPQVGLLAFETARALEKKDEQIADLTQRLEALEKREGDGAA